MHRALAGYHRMLFERNIPVDIPSAREITAAIDNDLRADPRLFTLLADHPTKAGADPNRIQLRYSAPAALEPDGSLRVETAPGWMTESAPVAWQEKGELRIPVRVAFRIVSDRVVGFSLGHHDRELPVIIDPTLTWNTFLGSASEDQGYAIAVDADGNSYVTGWSQVTWGEPVRPFYGDPGFANAFVAKLDSAGTLVWNTFLGDIDLADGAGIVVDTSGSCYVVGSSSTWWDACSSGSGRRGWSRPTWRVSSYAQRTHEGRGRSTGWAMTPSG